eukprot:m.33651 g.33651  ORF g.33651 m.33651 type:complete len:585 (+) comp15281_c1_seq2:24-1778(+)
MGGDGKSNPLHSIAQHGDIKILQQALKTCRDPNVQDTHGMTPLHYASWYGHPQCVQALIQAGANVNAFDHDGATAMHAAAFNGQLVCLLLLVEAGANATVSDNDNMTPKDQAANENQADVVAYLRHIEEQQKATEHLRRSELAFLEAKERLRVATSNSNKATKEAKKKIILMEKERKKTLKRMKKGGKGKKSTTPEPQQDRAPSFSQVAGSPSMQSLDALKKKPSDPTLPRRSSSSANNNPVVSVDQASVHSFSSSSGGTSKGNRLHVRHSSDTRSRLSDRSDSSGGGRDPLPKRSVSFSEDSPRTMRARDIKRAASVTGSPLTSPKHSKGTNKRSREKGSRGELREHRDEDVRERDTEHHHQSYHRDRKESESSATGTNRRKKDKKKDKHKEKHKTKHRSSRDRDGSSADDNSEDEEDLTTMSLRRPSSLSRGETDVDGDIYVNDQRVGESNYTNDPHVYQNSEHTYENGGHEQERQYENTPNQEANQEEEEADDHPYYDDLKPEGVDADLATEMMLAQLEADRDEIESLELFLQSLDLRDFLRVFEQAQYDLEKLRRCSAQDLMSLGLPTGVRKKIMAALRP